MALSLSCLYIFLRTWSIYVCLVGQLGVVNARSNFVNARWQIEGYKNCWSSFTTILLLEMWQSTFIMLNSLLVPREAQLWFWVIILSCKMLQCLVLQLHHWVPYFQGCTTVVGRKSSVQSLDLSISYGLEYTLPPQLYCDFLSILNHSLHCNSAMKELHLQFCDFEPLRHLSILSQALRKDPDMLWLKIRRSNSLCIGSNCQGMSLTVKDLIAMSRVKDCLSGALLFVKEVVMMSIIVAITSIMSVKYGVVKPHFSTNAGSPK